MKLSLSVVTGLLWFGVLAATVRAYYEPCSNAKLRATPLCDVKLSSEERSDKFVSMLTVDEKISQLVDSAKAIDRVGLAGYEWWSEALHGVKADCFSGNCPTSYPAAIGLGASFNMGLVYNIATEISDEAHAMHDKADLKKPYGLNVWAPNINIFHDPRWGRGQETPGEDPHLTSMYAFHYVTGLQTGIDDDNYRKLVATVKHFAVYNVEKWNGVDRMHFDAKVSQQDLFQTYLVAFETAVTKADVQSIMCSYNSVNGIPACAHTYLLDQVLRKQWGFSGFVTSDCDAVYDIWGSHHYLKDAAEASAAAIRAGTDLDCGSTYRKGLGDALKRGLVAKEDIDIALKRLFKARVELGIFDDLSKQEYAKIPLSIVNSAAHRQTARRAARESLVLLKNSGNVLPLVPDEVRKLALVGPHADATVDLLSNYYGGVPAITSILEGLRIALAPHASVEHEKGCDINSDDESRIEKAVTLARNADVTVVVVGINQDIESEGRDRTEISLPGKQQKLIEAVADANPHHNTIVVVVSGGPIDISFARDNAKVAAIVWAFYPGEEGGNAVADVLLGKYSPSGRLPYTIYPAEYVNDVSMFEQSMADGVGRTYRFYKGTPVYPFGFGLSYTKFDLSFATPPSVSMLFGNAGVTLQINVKNVGSRPSDTSVLAFVETSHPDCPRRQLFAFDKVQNLGVGHVHLVKFKFEALDALCVNKHGQRTRPTGSYSIVIGADEVGMARLRHDVIVDASVPMPM